MVVCQNGHQQPDNGSSFCTECGTPLSGPAKSKTDSRICHRCWHQSHDEDSAVCVRCGAMLWPPPAWANIQMQPGQQTRERQPASVVPNPVPQQVNYAQPAKFQPVQVKPCQTCGGNGRHLSQQVLICKECKWLRPLAYGYGIEPSAFQWAEDGKAMSALRSMTPLRMAAQAISDKVGRRWIETTFNGVRLSENQLPQVYSQAVKAARILGVSYMPDVYVSGEFMWDCRTYGSDKEAFILIGSSLAANFSGPELLFLFAREMGHCRTGHALWKTVIKFLMGEQQRKGLLAGGLFSALSPTALLEGSIEIPLLAWARQAEITADRAGMLVVGDENVVRRVLITWSLRSPVLFKQVNVDAWLEQQSGGDDDFTRLSELMTSATPYLTRRLKLIEKFAQSPELSRWQRIIRECDTRSATKKDRNKQADIRLKCASCGTAMRIPSAILEGKEKMAIRCPDPKCGKMTYLKKNVKPAAAGGNGDHHMEINSDYDE